MKKSIEMLIKMHEENPGLCDVSHKDFINRDRKEVAYSQIDLLMSENYDIAKFDF